MESKIIGIIDEDAVPPILESLDETSPKAAIAMPLNKGIMDERILAFLLDRLSDAMSQPAMVEGIGRLKTSDTPFSGLIKVLGIQVAPEVDEAMVAKLNANIKARIQGE